MAPKRMRDHSQRHAAANTRTNNKNVSKSVNKKYEEQELMLVVTVPSAMPLHATTAANEAEQQLRRCGRVRNGADA